MNASYHLLFSGTFCYLTFNPLYSAASIPASILWIGVSMVTQYDVLRPSKIALKWGYVSAFWSLAIFVILSVNAF